MRCLSVDQQNKVVFYQQPRLVFTLRCWVFAVSYIIGVTSRFVRFGVSMCSLLSVVSSPIPREHSPARKSFAGAARHLLPEHHPQWGKLVVDRNRS